MNEANVNSNQSEPDVQSAPDTESDAANDDFTFDVEEALNTGFLTQTGEAINVFYQLKASLNKLTGGDGEMKPTMMSAIDSCIDNLVLVNQIAGSYIRDHFADDEADAG